jgi:NADH-quinone oxidoreductase subunit J
MQLFDIVFFVFAFITLCSAFIVVFSRNIIYSAFALLFTFFGVAGLYVLLQADFLAVTQLLIYVGGILVLLLFGVMLTNNIISVDIKTGSMQTVPALLIVAVVAGSLSGLFYSTWKDTSTGTPSTLQTTTRPIGEMLMTSYLLPFEIASVILLVALIGAALISRKEKKLVR